MIFSDLALSQRLERAEGQSGAAFVDSRARLMPETGATWRSIAGAYVMFDGVSSPITQTFALGIEGTPSEADMEAIEAFYAERGAPVFHEVSPLVDDATVALLNARGYQPCELTSVMFRPLDAIAPPAAAPTGVTVNAVAPDAATAWIRTSMKGWSEFPEYAPMMEELARVSVGTEGTVLFLAELAGQSIAAGGLNIRSGVALLAGASTIPEARRRGAQNALLYARLAHAAQAGCDLAMMCAKPGSASQRNAERHGFRIAYTRIKWMRAAPTA